MIASVTKLQTASSSFYEVHPLAHGWRVSLVTPTPVGFKNLRTALYRAPTFEEAHALAADAGARTHRPVKVKGRKP